MGMTNLPPSSANCLEIWESQPPGTLRSCNGIALLLPLYNSFNNGFLGYHTVLGNGSKVCLDVLWRLAASILKTPELGSGGG